eukprot:gene10477-2999_t
MASWQTKKFGNTATKEPSLVASISCFCFNKDKSMIALSPNDNTVEIYATNGSQDTTKWTKKYDLKEHTKLVMDIDWSKNTNAILTAGQDRNAYVWTLDGDEWKPSLVLLKIHRSATCCRWAVNEDKFAVGSGAKILSICYYDEDNKWWVSKMVKKNKPHASTILTCAWHPTDNLLLLTGCGDSKARALTCYLKDTDPKSRKTEFPTINAEHDVTGWVHCVTWSPSGDSYAFTGHDSTLYVAKSDSHEVTAVPTKFNPFKKLLYLSETSIVAVGHDFTPIVFSSSEGEWKCYGAHGITEKKQETRPTFGQKPTSSGPETRHKNTINSISIFAESGGKVSEFCTAGLDGRICFWKVADIEKAVSGFKA